MNIRVLFAFALTFAAAAASCGGRLASNDCAANDTCIADAGPVSCPFGTEDIDNECVPFPSPPPSDAAPAPPPVSSPPDASDGGIDMSTACLGGGNRFVIAGNDWVHMGAPLMLGAAQSWLGDDPDLAIDGKAETVSVSISDRGPIDDSYDLIFSSKGLNEPLEVRSYSPAGTDIPNPTIAALDVSGEGHGCESSGEFNVLEITSYTDDRGYPILHSFTATFLQHCQSANPYAYNYGCVHVENCDTGECIATPSGDE